MDLVIALLALILGLCAITRTLAHLARRRARSSARAEVKAGAEARWEVAEVSGVRVSRRLASAADQDGAGGSGTATQVVIVRRTGDGKELGRIVVASVADSDPEWDERMLQARSTASARADLLNAKP